MYNVHKRKPFYFTLTLLSFFFWYPRQNGKGYKTFFAVSGILRAISLLSALGTVAHAIIVIKDKTGIDISEDIGDLGGCAGCLAICISFMFYHDKWSNFFNDLLNFKHFGEPPKYEEVVKRGNLISLICILYTIPGMLWYCFVSYLRVPECQEMNKRHGLQEACGMVNPTWLPANAMDGTNFFLFYLFQTIGIFVYIPSSFALCVLPLEAVEVIVARINHLKILFKDVFKTNDRKLCITQLQHCISYHQEILRISKELSMLVSSSMGSICLTAAFVIGSLGSQLLKSLDITNYVYDSKWYEMDAKIKKDVVFVLARCQKPMYLAGPPLMTLSGYLLFCVVIKMSYSYLTLLNQMV